MPIDSETSQHYLSSHAVLAALKAQQIGIMHQNDQQVYDVAENLPAEWRMDEILGKRDKDAFPAPLGDLFQQHHEKCRRSGTTQLFTFELSEGVSTRVLEATVIPQADGVLTILTDVTEERNKEAAIADLLREVSHRSKNLLAIVQSVAMQTANHSGGISEFLDKFRSRLQALSSTQDLVTATDWRGTHLHDLLNSQLRRLENRSRPNVTLYGENPFLGPNAALHVGLAVHELALNAQNHGAFLRGSPGKINVRAQIEVSSGNKTLHFTWEETGNAELSNTGVPRFGSLVLERIVPLSVGGSAKLQIGRGSVTYQLSVPGDQFEG